MINVLLIGGPGAGKGTLSNYLTDKLMFGHISTGDLFRYHKENNTDIWKQSQEAITNGGLAGDEITLSMMKEELDKKMSNSEKNYERFVFDGFPRTLSQAPLLDNILSEYNMKLDLVINIAVPDEVLLDRLLKRNDPTRPEDKDLEYSNTRIKTYHEKTTPLLEYYMNRGNLITIDGTQVIEFIRVMVGAKILEIYDLKYGIK